MSIATSNLITAESLLEFSSRLGSCELIDGEMIPMSPAGFEHGYVAMKLAARLCVYVDDHKLGSVLAAETGFVLSRNPDTVRAPDVAFVTESRTQRGVAGKSYFEGAPDLAVEVVSPHDTFSDVEAKALAWIEAGCRLVWVVDPRQQHVTEYRSLSEIRVFKRGEMLSAEDLVPGWSLKVSSLFV